MEAHLALLMPRAMYGGPASASVAVTGAAGLLPTEAEDQGKLVITGEFGGGACARVLIENMQMTLSVT